MQLRLGVRSHRGIEVELSLQVWTPQQGWDEGKPSKASEASRAQN